MYLRIHRVYVKAIIVMFLNCLFYENFNPQSQLKQEYYRLLVIFFSQIMLKYASTHLQKTKPFKSKY